MSLLQRVDYMLCNLIVVYVCVTQRCVSLYSSLYLKSTFKLWRFCDVVCGEVIKSVPGTISGFAVFRLNDWATIILWAVPWFIYTQVYEEFEKPQGWLYRITVCYFSPFFSFFPGWRIWWLMVSLDLFLVVPSWHNELHENLVFSVKRQWSVGFL